MSSTHPVRKPLCVMLMFAWPLLMGGAVGGHLLSAQTRQYWTSAPDLTPGQDSTAAAYMAFAVIGAAAGGLAWPGRVRIRAACVATAAACAPVLCAMAAAGLTFICNFRPQIHIWGC